MVEIDHNLFYEIPFVGGPFDGQKFKLRPAQRQVHRQCAPNGNFLRNCVYELREYVHEATGHVVKLEYHFLPDVRTL